MDYIFLIIGFVLLIKGADFFVDGSAALAGYLKVPSVIIGLTIVAIGTSLPEAAVSISAGLAGSNEIAVSNIVGSNIFNTLVVVGASALIRPFAADSQIVKRDLPVNFLVTVILYIMVIGGMLSRIEGLILLAGIITYITVMVRSALKNRVEEEIEPISLSKAALFIALGLAAVVFGGDVVVDSATAIAKSLGLSETLIGLTIVAIGTSLPELVTSVVASRKGESGLALGNAIGSNIFNILFILGMSSTLMPIPVVSENITDALVLIGICVLIYAFARFGEKIGRIKGLIMIAIYIAYTAYIIMR
ncbi:MAG TPA: calcium/sodium antiporter [Candidatus Avanaerovorax faecigallinarum]|nr:calcium/sodium antiporter [Candidatus Avanaerovorax faecigallinarum]